MGRVVLHRLHRPKRPVKKSLVDLPRKARARKHHCNAKYMVVFAAPHAFEPLIGGRFHVVIPLCVPLLRWWGKFELTLQLADLRHECAKLEAEFLVLVREFGQRVTSGCVTLVDKEDSGCKPLEERARWYALRHPIWGRGCDDAEE